MQFSVVIPLFDKGPHVEGTVASALAQSLPPLEIIVVDDGSRDDGLAKVRAIDDPRIRIFERSPPGPGGYAARNLGVEQAKGEWIAFLDADDIWHPDHLRNLARAIAEADAPVGCAFAAPQFVEGGKSRPYPLSTRYLCAGRPHDLATMLRAWLDVVMCPMWTGALAFRREILMEAGLFPDGRASRGGDKDLWLRCMALGGTAYSPQSTAEFHQDTVNRVSNIASHVDLPIICQTIASMLPSVGPEERTLLRRLANQEIGLYARYATAKRSHFGRQFFRALYLPEGLKEAATLAVLKPLGVLLRIFDPKRRFF